MVTLLVLMLIATELALVWVSWPAEDRAELRVWLHRHVFAEPPPRPVREPGWCLAEARQRRDYWPVQVRSAYAWRVPIPAEPVVVDTSPLNQPAVHPRPMERERVA